MRESLARTGLSRSRQLSVHFGEYLLDFGSEYAICITLRSNRTAPPAADLPFSFER